MRFAALLLLAGNAVAGPGRLGGQDEVPDDGTLYWGYVKDQAGAPVRDARVSATHKSLTLVGRSDATGAYRLPGFKKDVKPEEVVISCSKEGYRQLRVVRPPLPKVRPLLSVETECRLQRAR